MCSVLTYFVLGENIGHVRMLCLSNLLLSCVICVLLSDRIVLHFLALDEGIGYFMIWVWYTLEVALFVDIVIHIVLPGAIAIGETVLLCSIGCVHFR